MNQNHCNRFQLLKIRQCHPREGERQDMEMQRQEMTLNEKKMGQMSHPIKGPSLVKHRGFVCELWIEKY